MKPPANRRPGHRKQVQKIDFEQWCVVCGGNESREVEKRAHSILSEKRMSGEWFSVSTDVAKAAVDQAIKAVRSEMTFEDDPAEETKKKIIGRTTFRAGRRILPLIKPLTIGDLVLMRTIISQSLIYGWPIEHGLVCELAKGKVADYLNDGDLAQSLERLRCFPLAWSEGRTFMGFSPLFNYQFNAGAASLRAEISSCVLRICRNHGLETFGSSEKIVG